MLAERGSSFLLKIGSEDEPFVYSTVGGLRTTQVAISGDTVAITDRGSGGWRSLLSEAGVRSVSVQATGLFTGSNAEGRLRELALAGRIAPYLLTFEGGNTMSGRFLITKLEYAGDYDDERSYRISLESSGPIIGA